MPGFYGTKIQNVTSNFSSVHFSNDGVTNDLALVTPESQHLTAFSFTAGTPEGDLKFNAYNKWLYFYQKDGNVNLGHKANFDVNAMEEFETQRSKVDDNALAVQFLTFDEAGHITGQTIKSYNFTARTIVDLENRIKALEDQIKKIETTKVVVK